MMMFVRTVLIALVVSLSSVTAGAQSTNGAGAAPLTSFAYAQPAPSAVEPSYHGQLILTDVGAWVAAMSLAAADDGLGASAFLAGYLLGSPIVHLVHGNGGRAAGSLALRAGLPVLGAMLGAGMGAGDCSDEWECAFGSMGGAVIGALVGMGSAAVIDWSILGREKVIEPVEVSGVAVTPRFAVGRDGQWSAGIGGWW